VNRDQEHLDLLAIFHYILAGLTALGACVPILHVGMGVFILMAAPADEVPRLVGILLVVFASVAILAGWTLAIALFMAGRRLSGRRGRTFCLVVAALSCLMVPLGTVLGIFTLVVLSRGSVQQLFLEGSP
jgi:hypothetical protein